MTNWDDLAARATEAAARESLTILVVDPGRMTGWSLWALEPDMAMMRLEYGGVHGGMAAFLEWMENRLGPMRPSLVLCELFNPLLGYADEGKDYEALRIEGALAAVCRALGLDLRMQPTSMKALCRDDDLRRAGLYITPSEAKVDPAIMWTDARDVNDTQRHALAWAKAHGHQPTVDRFWPDEPRTD